MEQLKQIINRVEKRKESQRISKEFQDFGVRLAEALGDNKHKSLYIKLAKEKPRQALEEALSYVQDYTHATSKGRLFMWRLKKIESETDLPAEALAKAGSEKKGK